jgi:hypothetical protein
MIAALAALSLLSEGPLVPADVPPASVALSPAPAPSLSEKSPWAALSLTLACELPTAFFGPSCGHLYAGEQAHFVLTGGLRAADFLALVILEKWGYGVPPLYDVVQPHFSRSLAAEPLAYPVDLILVALWWGTGLYDLIDSVFAARRANRRASLLRPSASAPVAGLTLLEF